MSRYFRIANKLLLRSLGDYEDHYSLVLLAGILLQAFAVRIIGLGNESLWTDEIISVQRSQLGLPDLLTETQGHQPLYFILLNQWTNLFGNSEISLRFPSVIFGVLTVAVTYPLARLFTGIWGALMAALLVAISPVMIWYSQEVRMYTMTAFLFAFCTYSVIKYMDRFQFRYLVGYAIGASLGAYTHFYFMYFIIALNLVVLSYLVRSREWRELGKWSFGHMLVFLPVLYRLVDVFLEVEAQIEGSLEGYTEPVLKVLPQYVRLVGFEEFKLGGPTFLVVLTIAIIGISAWVAILRGDRIQLLLPILLVPLVLLVAGAKILNLPIVMRYLVPTVPLWYLFPAYGLGLITRSFPKLKFLTLGLAICTVGIIVGWSGFAWYQQLHIPTKQQWRELANLVESEASASDTIYVVPKHHFRHLDYYLNGTDVNIGSSVSDYSCPDQQNAAWLIGKVDLLGEAVQRLATSCGVVGSETFAGQLAVYKFSAQGVMVRCNGFAPTLIGTQDSDVINGTSADDVIHGLQGNDIINGLEGDDFICGGTGNDMLNGGVGDDQIFGEEGDDILNGGPGSNMLDGGPGRNALNDGLGNDPID